MYHFQTEALKGSHSSPSTGSSSRWRLPHGRGSYSEEDEELSHSQQALKRRETNLSSLAVKLWGPILTTQSSIS